MKQRGRKAAASLAVIPSGPERRLPAPDYLSEAERELWATTVAALPGDWFAAEQAELLANYCRHSIAVRRLSKFLSDAEDLDEIEKLLKSRERESRAALSYARALRLTNQSRQEAKTAARHADTARGSVYERMELEGWGQ